MLCKMPGISILNVNSIIITLFLTSLGCLTSQQMHKHFYGSLPFATLPDENKDTNQTCPYLFQVKSPTNAWSAQKLSAKAPT